MQINHTFELYPSFSATVTFFDSVVVNKRKNEGASETTNNQKHKLSPGDILRVYFDLDLVPGTFTILTAINKTLSRYDRDKQEFKLKTNSLGSEFLYNLSPFTSITNALHNFGVSSTTKKAGLLCIQKQNAVDANANVPVNFLGNMPDFLQGNPIAVADAFNISCDEARCTRIRRYCKISDPELLISGLDDAFALHVAMRDVK